MTPWKSITLCLVALILPSGCSKHESGTRIVRVGLSHGQSHSFNQALERFGTLVEQRSAGRFEVVIYHSSQVGSEKEMQEMLSIGSLDVSLSGVINQYEPLFSILEMPYLYRDRKHVFAVNTSRIVTEIGSSLESNGIHLLGFYENGFRNISNSVRPINEPEDLRGLLIRTPENPAQIETIRALGAIPTPMSFSELYTALIQGVVDGQENPLQNIWFGRLHEAQRHVAMTRHIYNSVWVVVSWRLWSSLDDADRKVFEECMLESCLWQLAFAEAEEIEFEQKMKAFGVEFTYPDLEPFERQAESAYEAIFKKLGPEAEAIVERIRRMK